MGKKVISIIPQSAMDKIITELINSKKELILSKINEYAIENNIFMNTDSIKGESTQGNIKISVNIQAVDYEGIAEYILPLAAEKAKAYSGDDIFIKAFGKMKYISEGLGKTFLQALPQETKDELVIYLINNYQDDIVRMVNKHLQKNNIKIKINNMS
ncbi:MAG: hypothetical protein LUD77_05345, partial [Clostridiales bacterium]|nr:hypothetical protein [Clostridiales bacterium]